MIIGELLTKFAAAPCGGGGFLGFPSWYKYLPSVDGSDPCAPQISGIGDIWLIGAAIVEILLRIAALAAITFIVVGGVSLITSEGQPEKAAKARNTILNAVIGLVIAVSATALVTFIAGRFN